MDNVRRTIRTLLFEQKMDQAFIVSKAQEEGLHVAGVSQDGLKIMVHLKAPADEKPIRRFKNQLRIKNPRLERIEVRQPETDKKAEDSEQQKKDVPYAEWRNKMLTNLKRTASELGWNLYTDPKAGKETEYFLIVRGEGSEREVIRVRVSSHPTSLEKSELSFDMSGQENTLADLRARLQKKRTPKDEYPLI